MDLFFCLITETMDSRPTYNEIPWQLIISALQGELSPEENVRFGEWLAASPVNRETYEQLLNMWKEEMADYSMYRQADETQGWEAFQRKLQSTQEEKPIIARRGFGRQPSRLRHWSIAAVLVLLTAGTALWYISGKDEGLQYETAIGEQRTLSLPDGSTLVLQSNTRVRVAGNYNKTTRTITLLGGKASFDVAHQQQRPFVVEMDAATVKDIGTSFTIDKSPDSITVAVSQGKIAFTEKVTGAMRELGAGEAVCLYTSLERRGEVRASKTIEDSTSLRFDNAVLTTVISALEKRFGRQILLGDTSIAQRRLTVHLDGESFDDALKTICFSLHLQYSMEANGTILVK